jgi:hypothetical protein
LNKLEKGPLRDYETGFLLTCGTYGSGEDLKDFAFFQVFHFLFLKYSEYANLMNKS